MDLGFIENRIQQQSDKRMVRNRAAVEKKENNIGFKILLSC